MWAGPTPISSLPVLAASVTPLEASATRSLTKTRTDPSSTRPSQGEPPDALATHPDLVVFTLLAEQETNSFSPLGCVQFNECEEDRANNSSLKRWRVEQVPSGYIYLR